MSTKNYVVWTNCDITGEVGRQFNIESCSSPEQRQAYNDMFAMSHASATKFLQGPWEAVVFDQPAETRVHMFWHNWQRIWDLWHSGSCNILYLDSDTLFVRPTELFGRFSEFRLFNWTDPKNNQEFADYFNAGVRYYPSTMSESVWEIGSSIAKDWNLNIWDQEQLIFNRMYWSQQITPEDQRHPEFNWQGMMLTHPDPRMQAAHEQWNGLPLSQANILHVHGSRGPINTANLMKNICQQLNIDV